ncbi:MAG: leucine-rich repeat protein [Muribaculaceae bacterium]|nr:leucine-rich repeat protein [Muribaculaceae bacterium]
MKLKTLLASLFVALMMAAGMTAEAVQIKHPWNGDDWTWQNMTDAGDGTYVYTGLYGNAGANINSEGNYIASIPGTEGMAVGDPVLFTYNSADNSLKAEYADLWLAGDFPDYSWKTTGDIPYKFQRSGSTYSLTVTLPAEPALYHFKVSGENWCYSWGKDVEFKADVPANALDINSMANAYANFGGSFTVTFDLRTRTLSFEPTITLNHTVLNVSYNQRPQLVASAGSWLGSGVTWTSSDYKIEVDENGVITPIGAKTATVTATCGGKSATCTVTSTLDYGYDFVTNDGATITHPGSDPVAADLAYYIVGDGKVEVGCPSGISYIDELTIPSTVTYEGKTYTVVGVGDRGFFDKSGLTKVNMPATVTYVGRSSFYNVTTLTEITIPDAVTEIRDYAFYGCYKAETLSLGKSLETIGNYSFKNCAGIEEITIPDAVTEIGQHAFGGTQGYTGDKEMKLKKVTLGKNVKVIRESAFGHCHNLEEVVMNESLERLERVVFMYCNLKELILPETIAFIGMYACPIVEDDFYYLPKSNPNFKQVIVRAADPSKIKFEENGEDVFYYFQQSSNGKTRTVYPPNPKKVYLWAPTGTGSECLKAYTWEDMICIEMTMPQTMLLAVGDSYDQMSAKVLEPQSDQMSAKVLDPQSDQYIDWTVDDNEIATAVPGQPEEEHPYYKTCDGEAIATGITTITATLYDPDGTPLTSCECVVTVVDMTAPGALLLPEKQSYSFADNTNVIWPDGIPEGATVEYTLTDDDGLAMSTDGTGTVTALAGAASTAGHGTVVIELKDPDGKVLVTRECKITVTPEGGIITGIDTIDADNTAAEQYFTLQGIAVGKNALQPGLYIVKQGDKSRKVIVK